MPNSPGSWQRRVEQGLCGECGQRKPEANAKRCRRCLDRKSKQKRRKENRVLHHARQKESHEAQLVHAKEPEIRKERAEVKKMLTEVKLLIDDVRPFYDKAVEHLAINYEDLMKAEVQSALYEHDPIEARRSRQFLLTMFPKLIPPQARNEDDALAAVAHAIEEKGGKIVLAAEVGSNGYQANEDGEKEPLTVDVSYRSADSPEISL